MKLFADSSIGIISGADGPTAVMVTGNPVATIIVAVSVVVIAVLSIIFIVKKRNKK